MSKLVILEETKTYASHENAVKAFEKKFGHTDLRYFIMRTETGCYFPVCLDASKAMQNGVHFHFHVLG